MTEPRAHAPVPEPEPDAPDWAEPIRYLGRSRSYYLALGYPAYRWAYFAEVPFATLREPLAGSTVGLVTTAAPYQPDLAQPGFDNQGPGAPYHAAAKFHAVYSSSTAERPDLRISHIAYDRAHTSAADPNTYVPLARLREAAGAGRIGRIAARFHGVPTTRSQSSTREVDAPEVLRRLREDGVDAALLVPN